MINRKRKRGEKHESQDLYFWRYMKTSVNGQYWVTLEELNRLKKITREQTNKWNEKNPEKVKELHRQFLEKNPGYHAKAKAKQRKLRGKEFNEYIKSWKKNNPERARAIRMRAKKNLSIWRKNKIKTDPIYALKNTTRARIGKFVKKMGIYSREKSTKIIGCSWEELKNHLESKFKDGMTWQNRVEWHIDHIIPLSSAKTKEKVLELFHYTNLQPLWAHENMKKSNKLNYQFD